MFELERKELVKKLKNKGIGNEQVLSAIEKVERHKFIPDALKYDPYDDKALPIGYNQTISQPYTVAFMTQALKLKKNDRVLEVGTGSGYQAAILFEMGMKVFSIERQFEIYLRTQKLFDELEIRVLMKYGDGTIGWEEYAPFDGIIVTAGSPKIPEQLKKQLQIGGRMVIPVGDKVSQYLKVMLKKSDDEFQVIDIPDFAFVPLIGREGWSEK